MADANPIEKTWIVYRITCAVTGEVYIGLTCLSLKRRWTAHIYQAKSGNSRGPLQRAILKYGADVFSIEALYEAVDARECAAVERGLISQYGTLHPAGMNFSTGGELYSGVARTAETRKTVSEIIKAKWADPEYRERMIESFQDRVIPDSHIEHLRKLSASQKGKPRSRESVEKGRAKLMGHHVSEETRAKIGAKSKGRKASAETLEKMRVSSTGRKQTPEVCAKMRIALKAAWDDPVKRAERMRKNIISRAHKRKQPDLLGDENG